MHCSGAEWLKVMVNNRHYLYVCSSFSFSFSFYANGFCFVYAQYLWISVWTASVHNAVVRVIVYCVRTDQKMTILLR